MVFDEMQVHFGDRAMVHIHIIRDTYTGYEADDRVVWTGSHLDRILCPVAWGQANDIL